MPFEAIPGRFHTVGYAPDGDTVRFEPDEPDALLALGGRPVAVNRRGHASIRFEAIDTPETHFGRLHQPLALADAATDRMLALIGVEGVEWTARRGSVSAAEDGVTGTVVARRTDKFGRIIGFVYPDRASPAEAGTFRLEADMLEGSVNAALLAEGLAYPTFYWTLFADLREDLAARAVAARGAGRGVHAVDRTEALAVTSLAVLEEEAMILPKLFRRAATYVVETGGIEGFKAALEANREPVLDLRDGNITHFDTFVREDGETIGLTRRPEELVFDPMPERPGGSFALMLGEVMLV